MVVYNDQQANVVFNFNDQFRNLDDLRSRVFGASYLQSGTSLLNGVNTALSQVLYSGNVRSSAWTSAIVITNNLQSSQNTNDLQNALLNLRRAVSVVYAVAINAANAVDITTLNSVGLNTNGIIRTSYFTSYTDLLNSNNALLVAQRVCEPPGQCINTHGYICFTRVSSVST